MDNKIFNHQIAQAKNIIDTYNGQLPLAAYLKNYFSENRKAGSKDRKIISAIVYNFFRILAYTNNNNREIIFEKAKFFTENNFNLNKKIEALKQVDKNENIFIQSISTQIDVENYKKGFLTEPKTFIRIRPNKHSACIDELKENNIAFTEIDKNCFSVEGHPALTQLKGLNENFVIQDYASQSVFDKINFDNKIYNIWDCCAASGGKSILIYDKLSTKPNITVSDIRPTIIKNLLIRLRQAKIKINENFICDLTENYNSEKKYDLLIADVPCSGSGTWHRTPEALYFFNAEKIKQYKQTQLKIVQNAIKNLNKGAIFIYITCSVFKEENEENVTEINKLLNNTPFFVGYINKFSFGGDCLFSAAWKFG